jgi:hypothetical protein
VGSAPGFVLGLAPISNPDWTDADPEIAAAWHRLRTSAGTETGRLLLKHEAAEMWYRRNVNSDYSQAHARANRHWNWQRVVEDKYGDQIPNL